MSMSPVLAEDTCVFSELPAEVCQCGAALTWLSQSDCFSQGRINQPPLK